jgi:hypothetical protein
LVKTLPAPDQTPPIIQGLPPGLPPDGKNPTVVPKEKKTTQLPAPGGSMEMKTFTHTEVDDLTQRMSQSSFISVGPQPTLTASSQYDVKTEPSLQESSSYSSSISYSAPPPVRSSSPPPLKGVAGREEEKLKTKKKKKKAKDQMGVYEELT